MKARAITQASAKTRTIGKNDFTNFLPSLRRGIDMKSLDGPMSWSEHGVASWTHSKLSHPLYRSFLNNAVIVLWCIHVIEKLFGSWQVLDLGKRNPASSYRL